MDAVVLETPLCNGLPVQVWRVNHRSMRGRDIKWLDATSRLSRGKGYVAQFRFVTGQPVKRVSRSRIEVSSVDKDVEVAAINLKPLRVTGQCLRGDVNYCVVAILWR